MLTPTLTIPISNTLSDAYPLNDGTHLVGFLLPAAWDGTDLAFDASLDRTNFFPVYDSYGIELIAKVAASRLITMPANFLLGTTAFRLRAKTTQTAARAVRLIVREY